MVASWFDADMTMGDFNKRDSCATCSSSTSKLGTRPGVDIRKNGALPAFSNCCFGLLRCRCRSKSDNFAQRLAERPENVHKPNKSLLRPL
ncbi:hypothetical protein T07_6938 [Trichinella nelsoni]|uniref:Uncharacterized protein n=2 Tax=Trichinella nelsoni TaxID=6336 RepID=A0A0V0RDL5_9BILA|nr:hypothetical protein T07_9976 [Trichinella nelsoni]KRX12732.1 hypothetical protein T07_6938 [Trichinella nelsoni]